MFFNLLFMFFFCQHVRFFAKQKQNMKCIRFARLFPQSIGYCFLIRFDTFCPTLCCVFLFFCSLPPQHNTMYTTPPTRHHLNNTIYTTPPMLHHHTIHHQTQQHQHYILHHQHYAIYTTPSTLHHQHYIPVCTAQGGSGSFKDSKL